MKHRRITGMVAGLLVLALAPAVAQADRTYTIRIEGQSATLLPKTTVTVPDGGAIPGAHSDCTWDKPAGALEKATGGNWDHSNFVKTILGEFHDTYTSSWFVWTNGQFGSGFCYLPTVNGADIVVTAGDFDANYNAVDLPLYLRDVPANAVKGTPITVSVVEPNPDIDPAYNSFVSDTGTPKPAAGATVTLGTASATTGADGKATLTPAESGSLTLQAKRGTTAARSETATVCVASSSSDGTCGTTKPTTTTAAPVVTVTGPDRVAPANVLKSVTEGKRYTASSAPRELKGTAADPSGILMVKLRITRNDKGRCSYFSGKSLTFRKMACGAEHGSWFKIGTSADWSYLLPQKLPRGRYVLDVNAIDKQYNRDDTRRRGGNRVVFTVA